MFFYAMPMYIPTALSFVAIIGIALIESIVKNKKLLTAIEFVIFLLALIFVIYVTIIHRNHSESVKISIVPFYSFVMAKDEIEVYRLILFNVLMFVPFGLTLPFLLHRQKHNIILSLLFTFLISLSIELIQLIFHLGTFEIDDLIFNTLGSLSGMLGYYMYLLIMKFKMPNKNIVEV